MTTVPTVSRFDDFRLALWDLTAGTKAMISPQSVLDLQFETVPGVDGDRLKSATFEIPWYEDARNEIDFDNLQLLQIDRYSDTNWTSWGILLKPSEGYSGRQRRDTIKIQVAQVEEFLRSRKVYKNTAGTIEAVSATGVYADDFAKAVVTACFSGTDKDAASREWEWGTLVVEADASECIDTHDFTALSGPDDNDTLLKWVDDLSRTYDFDYQLAVSVTGGAFTFTFKTKAPYGGEDLTSGANRVMIKDLLGMIPAARRYRDAAFRATVMHVGGYQSTATDAAGLATWGRWEGSVQGKETTDAEQALERVGVAQGAEYEFEASGANGMTRWLEHFKAGDSVLRINNRLEIAADSEQIAAVIGRFENKVLRLTIRWGDREPAGSDRGQGGAYATNKGPEARIPVDPEPVATASTPGTDPYALVYGDHQHALQVTAEDSGVAEIDAAGVLDVVGSGGIVTSIVGGDLTIDGAAIQGALHDPVTLDVNADTILSLSTQALGLDTQTANYVWAGPVSGGAAVPAFRSLVAADIPAAAPAAHNIVGALHTITSAAMGVVGATALNTLGLLTPSADTSLGTEALLKSDANGDLTCRYLRVGASSFMEENSIATVLKIHGHTYIVLGWSGGDKIVMTASAFYPNLTLGIDLGSAGNIFDDLHIDDIILYTDIIPDTNNTGEIGDPSYYFNKAYVSNYYGGRLEISGDILVTGTVDEVDVLNHGHSLAYTGTASGAASIGAAMNHRHTILEMCTSYVLDHYHVVEASSGYYTGYLDLAHTHLYDKTNTPTGAPA